MMIMKRYSFLVGLLLSLMMLNSCDLFDLSENPKGFITPDKYFNTSAQIETVLTGCMYRAFHSWSGYAYNPALHRHSDQEEGGDLMIGLNHGSDIYALHFANIKDINFALRSIIDRGLEGTSQEEVEQLVGQLKFLRAWNYFQLVRMWGGMQILTEDDTGDYFIQLPKRSSVEETYAFIIQDFEEAIDKLPEDWGAFGRPNKWVAKALLAKAYLTMATAPLNDASYYSKAASLAKEVIDSHKYSLVEDIRDVFSMATEEGPEMMWSFVANDECPSTDPRIWSTIYGWGDYSADQVWVDSTYNEQPRKHVYLETHDKNGTSATELGRNAGIQKYLYDTQENFDRGFTTVNIPIIRYADVLLIFAEAENMSNGGPTQAAVDAINSVINRANDYQPNPNYPLLTTNMTQEAFDKAVIHERNLELCFEYDRWNDIVRKRILYEVTREEYKHNFSESDYLFPIPESEIRLNPNIEQNPGY